ncbi:Uu.00g098590.m01.CDS01 [Anthostomella pinea]|uniref:Uu.00g098590.m01.CDS01 n=1 Tax=Anthostomella pinea TaxID=933095 RepID=A0AAI8VDM0_9PEZI|nr:Uu.00g098590.m01.CDS01 [Anthostomella pinea]
MLTLDHQAFYIGATTVLATMTHRTGLFVHQWDLRLSGLEHFVYCYLITTILYCFAISFIKASILLEWIRIFVPKSTRNRFFWICYAMVWANSLFYAITVITLNLTCVPRERIWRRWIPGTCININAFNLFISIFNLIFDVLILSLPHRVIWRLALSTRQKIGISFIFSVGIVYVAAPIEVLVSPTILDYVNAAPRTCVCAAGRVASAVNLTYNLDTTYAYSRHLIWGLAETTTAGLVFCVPAIPLAFRKGRNSTSTHDVSLLLRGIDIRNTEIRGSLVSRLSYSDDYTPRIIRTQNHHGASRHSDLYRDIYEDLSSWYRWLQLLSRDLHEQDACYFCCKIHSPLEPYNPYAQSLCSYEWICRIKRPRSFWKIPKVVIDAVILRASVGQDYRYTLTNVNTSRPITSPHGHFRYGRAFYKARVFDGKFVLRTQSAWYYHRGGSMSHDFFAADFDGACQHFKWSQERPFHEALGKIRSCDRCMTDYTTNLLQPLGGEEVLIFTSWSQLIAGPTYLDEEPRMNEYYRSLEPDGCVFEAFEPQRLVVDLGAKDTARILEDLRSLPDVKRTHRYICNYHSGRWD